MAFSFILSQISRWRRDSVGRVQEKGGDAIGRRALVVAQEAEIGVHGSATTNVASNFQGRPRCRCKLNGVRLRTNPLPPPLRVQETKRPSKEMQVTIARQLGLEPTTVGNFFMNARRRSMDKWKDEADAKNGTYTGTYPSYCRTVFARKSKLTNGISITKGGSHHSSSLELCDDDDMDLDLGHDDTDLDLDQDADDHDPDDML